MGLHLKFYFSQIVMKFGMYTRYRICNLILFIFFFKVASLKAFGSAVVGGKAASIYEDKYVINIIMYYQSCAVTK